MEKILTCFIFFERYFSSPCLLRLLINLWTWTVHAITVFPYSAAVVADRAVRAIWTILL